MNPPNHISVERIEELLAGAHRPPGGPRQSHPQSPPDPTCPAEEIWLKVAAHELDEEESLRLIEHAAGCQSCGAQLSYWATILSAEESPDELIAFSGLAVSKSGSQERLARKLAAGKGSGDASLASRFLSRRFFLPASLGFAGALAAGLLILLVPKGFRPQAAPERLLAEAYTGQRLMEARIPLADYSPIAPSHRKRAVGRGAMSDSVPLLEARAAITQALAKSPEDPHWLLLEARSDLLSGDYDSSIDTLKRILALDGSNVAALTDIASAYTLRSRATDVVSDQASALDYLEQAARIDPKNPVVLYNEAVVLQDLCQFTTSIDAWKRFLAVERNRQWLEDGRQRLAEAQAREAQCRQQQGRLSPFLTTPEGMLHLARSPDLLANYDEELSTIRLPLLLKTAFPQDPSAKASHSSDSLSPGECTATCSAARTLLLSVAASLRARHQDDWLADFLATSPGSDFVTGANLLADAISSDDKGNIAEGQKDSDAALPRFHAVHDTAGELRTRVQRIYEFQRLFEIHSCLSAASGLPEALGRRHYPWMTAQLSLDAAGCQNQQDDSASGIAELTSVLKQSAVAHYKILNARALALLAFEEATAGNYNLAWKLNMEGLHTFWTGDYPTVRGYVFYADLAYLEEASSRIYSSVVFHREELNVISQIDYPSVTTIDRFRLVKAAIRADDTQEAATQLRRAEEELVTLPGPQSLRNNAADGYLLLAEAYIARANPVQAASVLAKASGYMPGIENFELELRYATSMARLALLQGKNDQAELQLTRAILQAEGSFQRIHSQQERASWVRQVRDTYAALTLLRLREENNPLKALAIWERYRVMSSGVEPSRWCRGNDLACLARPLESIRQSLKDETVVATLRLGHTLVLWNLDNRGVQVHQLEVDPRQFGLLARDFADTVATPQSSEESVRLVGQKLSAVLLAPVAEALDPHRTLVFDLDDTMEFIPVAALPLNSGYLGMEYALTTVHSLLAASGMHRTGSALSPGLVIGASAPGDPEASPLPEARTEAIAVAAHLNSPRVLLGTGAAPQAVRNAVVGASLIHFAGHTQSYSGQTRLLLARDPASSESHREWLSAASFPASALSNCRLVVLSACSTGKREERDFDDSDEVVQTLAADGVPEIVATHWNVDSDAAVPLMKNFYAGLAQGLTAPQALSHAEAAVSSMAQYRHPYYWAAYYAVGLDRSNFKELVHD